jgi:hypothetical protein
MPRPSPRTLGKTVDLITGEEVFFKMFGTQQLKFIDPAKPALGVRQVDVKPTLRIGWFDYGTPTVRNTAYPDLTITKGVGTTTPAPFNGNGNGTGCECEACKNGTGECSDKNPKCNAWDLGCELFGATDKHGCECEACKTGTGQCSEKNPKCNAWDIGCEVTEGVTDIITDPVSSWWNKYGIWVYVVLGVIGLGILLWLLRPLFGFAKSVTEVKSAVTRVNGLK